MAKKATKLSPLERNKLAYQYYDMTGREYYFMTM